MREISSASWPERKPTISSNTQALTTSGFNQTLGHSGISSLAGPSTDDDDAAAPMSDMCPVAPTLGTTCREAAVPAVGAAVVGEALIAAPLPLTSSMPPACELNVGSLAAAAACMPTAAQLKGATGSRATWVGSSWCTALLCAAGASPSLAARPSAACRTNMGNCSRTIDALVSAVDPPICWWWVPRRNAVTAGKRETAAGEVALSDDSSATAGASAPSSKAPPSRCSSCTSSDSSSSAAAAATALELRLAVVELSLEEPLAPSVAPITAVSSWASCEVCTKPARPVHTFAIDSTEATPARLAAVCTGNSARKRSQASTPPAAWSWSSRGAETASTLASSSSSPSERPLSSPSRVWLALCSTSSSRVAGDSCPLTSIAPESLPATSLSVDATVRTAVVRALLCRRCQMLRSFSASAPASKKSASSKSRPITPLPAVGRVLCRDGSEWKLLPPMLAATRGGAAKSRTKIGVSECSAAGAYEELELVS
mmetsp:Transcript_19488/g.44794  ORF Transcript_19488/g.44794 Transcript_19488/m.44794 type:complete len:486 (+) Transcript_19488:1596-3053(+)